MTQASKETRRNGSYDTRKEGRRQGKEDIRCYKRKDSTENPEKKTGRRNKQITLKIPFTKYSL